MACQTKEETNSKEGHKLLLMETQDTPPLGLKHPNKVMSLCMDVCGLLCSVLV